MREGSFGNHDDLRRVKKKEKMDWKRMSKVNQKVDLFIFSSPNPYLPVTSSSYFDRHPTGSILPVFAAVCDARKRKLEILSTYLFYADYYVLYCKYDFQSLPSWFSGNSCKISGRGHSFRRFLPRHSQYHEVSPEIFPRKRISNLDKFAILHVVLKTKQRNIVWF